MSTYARTTTKPKQYTGTSNPDTIKHCLCVVNGIWKTIANNMTDDRVYVFTSVLDGYNEINQLLDRYNEYRDSYQDAHTDLVKATVHYRSKETADFETKSIGENETEFVFKINCSRIDTTQKQLLVNAFQSAPQIDRTEQNLKCKSEVHVSGDIISITIRFTVMQ